jgi:putative ABC transport system permease protein
MHPLHQKVRRDLRRLAGPMAAVVVVMACGVALFVMLRSMHGYLRSAQSAYYDTYRFADVFARPRRAPEALRTALAAIPGVATVETRIVFDVQLDVPGLLEPATGRLISLTMPNGPRVNRLQLRRGTLLDMRAGDAVVVNDAFARANGLDVGSRINAVINGRWRALRIVGTALSPEFVYAVRPGEIFPDNRRFGVVWMTRDALAAAFNMTGAFNDVAIEVDRTAAVPDVLTGVDRVLERYGGAGSFDREDQISHRFVSDEIAETEVTSLLLPTIFLGVTAFLLNLVLGRLVSAQRGQIAVLKAFGYGDWTIGGHYLELALIPVIAGGVAGTILGLYLASLMAAVYMRFFEFPAYTYRPDWQVVATALGISIAAALAGVWRAVREAVALPPAEAMQPPAPPSFSHGPLERVGRVLSDSVPLQITLRNIERRVGRSGFAVLGTACAVALVVASWFLFDAIDRARDMHFYVVQRDDVMVTFQDVHPSDTRRELARLPGVRRVEVFRSSPVRLRRGSVVKRTTALGMSPDGDLHQIADRSGAVHPLARGGVLLTAFLARQLGVTAGQTVTMEVLEGTRPVRDLRVAGLVDEVLGTTVYLPIDTLNDLLHEGNAVSGAFLAVNPADAPVLYTRLRGIPSISGVSVKQAMLAGFDQTLAESFAIPLRVLIGFACIIAAGVVYNGMTVALSERSRELATLRVLGFSPQEVERILIGEQGLLTAIGLPVGFGLGFALCVLMTVRFETEMFRLPLVVEASTYGVAAGGVLAAGAVAALIVRRRLAQLDLVGVLKARE